jgi:Co/Zn/Cd efflux system component
MSADCQHDHCENSQPNHPRVRKALWAALLINAAMFLVEIGAGLQANSTSLLADAIDFAGDAANYGLSLVVLGMAAVWRSRAALVKAASMGVFGVLVRAKALWMATTGVVPEAMTMGAVGLLALVANVSVALMLYAYRAGDANMRSVWLCTRNDAIGNVAVIVAAVGVFGTGTIWPDLAVAAVMGVLAIIAAWQVIGQARKELSAQTASHSHFH